MFSETRYALNGDLHIAYRASREGPRDIEVDVADDRMLATVLFTDIVDSTRTAARIGDRDWPRLA